MLAHRAFCITEVLLTAKAAVTTWEKVREEAEAFIANEVGAEGVIGSSESLVNSGPHLVSVTVWYRVRQPVVLARARGRGGIRGPRIRALEEGSRRRVARRGASDSRRGEWAPGD